MRIALALMLVLAPIEARAQLIATSFEELQRTLQQGETIQVTTASGDRLEGDVLDVSSSGLELRIRTPRPDGNVPAAAQRRLVEDDVRQIVRKHRDSLWNGTIIGLAAAAFPGIVTIAWGLSAADEGYTTGAEIAGAGIVMLGIGAGIGAAVDASLHRRTTVYLRSHATRSSLAWGPASLPWGPALAGPTLSVAPLLSQTAGGVRVSFQF